jgi:hypothetical protein
VVRGEVEKEDEGFEGGAHNGRRLTVVARVEKEDVAEWSPLSLWYDRVLLLVYGDR